ncbi:MAG: hypothetical protein Q7T74_04140 [Candidatus Saccharibacteria bacterium]|nr:hypothetical protein [Candidatus Saccharibacteria bacterium]
MRLLKNIKTLVLITAIMTVGIAVVGQQNVSAVSNSNFNPARIIDDGPFFNKNTMNTGDIQNFLNAKVPTCRSGYTCLKNYSQSFPGIGADSYCGGISGGTKSAANIIFDVAQACNVNPQTILVLLQKEQSLVTDDWPVDIQYRSATGYGCPDTAACDSEYYGFFNQVYRAARQFKRYVAQPQNYNYAAGRNSFIGYNPNSGCGGTNITIQNGATAALYNYTPYQPNPATLAAAPGQTVNCGAYGNLNFWRYFNDWFGPTTGTGYVLARNEDDNSQWIIYNNIKQYIPSGDIIDAYGLGSNPITMSGSYLASIPSGPSLGRLFHRTGSPALYFADGGKKYYVSSSQMKDVFGFNGQVESYVSEDLFDLPTDSGWLSYAVKKASNPALYMVDGQNSNQTVLRQYNSPDVFHAWEGDNAYITTLSDNYFNQIDNAIGSSLTGYTIKPSNSDSQYQVISGQKLYLSGAMATLYNQSYATVSPATANRLVTSSPASEFIRLPGNGVTIYMVDNGNKLPISSTDVLRAWAPNGSININILNQGFLNLLSTGTTVTGYEADVSGQLYLIDGKKYTVPTGLDNGYRTGSVASVSTGLMNLFSTDTVTGFIKGSGPAVYLVDAGVKRHIPSTEIWQLWNGSRGETLTQVSDTTLSQLTDGGQIGYYFSSGGTDYVIDNGTYRSVASGVATDWNLANPVSINAATRARFTSGAALLSKVKVGSTYYRIKYGESHSTTNTNIANIWGIDSSPTDVSNNLVSRIASGVPLSIYAKSTNTSDGRIFLVDNGATNFYHITTVEQMQNFGASSNLVPVTPTDLGTTGSALNILKTSTSGTERVIDNTTKRAFADNTIKNRWVTGSNVLTVSGALWNYFSDGATVNGNVKASAPNVYNIDMGQKRWILSQPSYQTYTSNYGAYSTISDFLVKILPAGADIP